MRTYEAITPLVAFDGFTKSGDFNHVPVEHLRMLDGLEYNEEDFVAYMEEPLRIAGKTTSVFRLVRSDSCTSVAAYLE